MRLLLVEDDELLAESLSKALTEQHYVIDVACDGEEGWNYAQSFTYDLILLDVSLPKTDGITLCRRLRAENNSNLILLLTAKGSSEDKVAGLDAGADDYVVKPCTVQELLARIRALLRRRSLDGGPILKWAGLQLDPSSREVTYQDQSLALSPTEYNLLELFMRNPKRVFSKSAILEHLWSSDDPPYEDTIRAHIKGLRYKLKKYQAEDLIETVYGVGYRLKVALESDLSKPQQTKAAVTQLWEKFKAPTLERIVVIEEAITAQEMDNLTTELQQKAEQQAHKLAGSLGMFGFAKASSIAKEIEQKLIACKAQLPESYHSASLKDLVVQLHQELDFPNGKLNQSLTSALPDLTKVSTPSLVLTESAPLLLIVDDDLSLIQQIQEEAISWNIKIKIAASIEDAKEVISKRNPDILLLDLAFPGNAKAGLKFLQEIKENYPNLLVLVFTARDEFDDRVAVARLGGRGFLTKPISGSGILEIAADLLRNSYSLETKILAVDDDPILLETLGQFLKDWGVKLHALTDPSQFWETLEATAPDLLILDVEMPIYNGIELCQVVRNDLTWQGLPIVFLSARHDAETIQQIYQAGADDYISKPVTEGELVTRIFNRLERTRLIRQIIETDPLTSVANRYHSTKVLNRYLRLAQRYQQPLCFALMDIDHFKQVNDRYGHATGDRVLKRLGQLLQLNFRSEDIVARWGGEEFVLGMYGMRQDSGIQRLEELLKAVREEVFLGVGNESSFHLTISAGVAEYPQHGMDLHHLYLAADSALYRAKAMGRNCVVAY